MRVCNGNAELPGGSGPNHDDLWLAAEDEQGGVSYRSCTKVTEVLPVQP